MIEIEFEPPSVRNCECCGKDTVSLTRFVYWNGGAHAVYYAQYGIGHDSRRVNGMVGLGDWGGDAKPEARLAFAFQIWDDDTSYNVALINASECPWSDVTFLGRPLERTEAIEHPWSKEVFHLTDHIVDEDPEIKAFFARSRQKP